MTLPMQLEEEEKLMQHRSNWVPSEFHFSFVQCVPSPMHQCKHFVFSNNIQITMHSIIMQSLSAIKRHV